MGSLILGFLGLLLSSIVTPFFARQRKLAGWLNFGFCALASSIFISVAFQAMTAQGVNNTSLSFGFGQIYFLVDGFSALFLVLISTMAALTALYSIGYMDHYPHYSLRSYLVHFPLFILGMVGMVTVDDFSIGFSVSWQLMTIASYFLIRFENQDPVILKSANKYLCLMELAWLFIVVAALLIPQSSMGDPMHTLIEKLGPAGNPLKTLVYGLLLLGFAFKAGVFPLGQLWLPDAHSVAPSPVSALMSGVMIKTGVYGIIRTFFSMLPASSTEYNGRPIAFVVACFGVITLFLGTVQALKQNDAKRLHAYSSIGQIGYIVLGVGSSLYFYYGDSDSLKALAVLALLGAIYHTINHAVFKGLLFLCTGSVQYATHTKDLNKLGGLIKAMPITTVVAAVAFVSIAGVPSFSGFMSKWAIISSNVLAGHESGIFALFGILALMTSAVTLALYVKFFGMTFTSSGSDLLKNKRIEEVPLTMLISKILLAGICITQGVLPFFFLGTLARVLSLSEGAIFQSLLAQTSISSSLSISAAGVVVNLPGASLASATAMPIVVLSVFLFSCAFAFWLKHVGRSSSRTGDVWLCGYQDLNDLNRFKSAGLYASFKNFMKWTGGKI